MASTLTGYPREPDETGAIGPVELGDLVIRTEPRFLRALGEHLLQAARQLEVGAEVETFVIPDAEPPRRNTPTTIMVFGINQHGK